MLLVEALALVLHGHPPAKPSRRGLHSTAATGGAILLDLVARGRVTVTQRAGVRLATIVDPAPTGEDVLDIGLKVMAPRTQTAEAGTAAMTIGVNSQRTLRERLAAAGVVRIERYRKWSIVPLEKTVLVDPAPVEAIRATLRGILVDEHPAAWHHAALVGILDELGALAAVLGDTGLSDRALRRRARDVAPDDLAMRAVRKVVKHPGGLPLGEPVFGPV